MEETRELAALMLNSTPAYVICIAALLTACREGPPVDFSDTQAVVAQAQIDVLLPAEKPVPQYNAKDISTEEKAPISALHVKPILLHAPPFMTPELSPRYAVLWVKCEGNKKRRISVDMIVGDGWEPSENDGRSFITSSGEITGQYRRFWQSNSIFFDDTLAVIPPLYETITKQVPNGNYGFETRSERRILDPQRPVRDVILPNLKTAKTMRLENKLTGAPGPTFDLTTINSDIERLEAQCSPKDATHAK